MVRYRDIPGIDEAYLAMDSEEGVEVVWNEAKFSSAKRFRAQEENMKNVFEALTLIDHPNIVKFHKFWTGELNICLKRMCNKGFYIDDCCRFERGVAQTAPSDLHHRVHVFRLSQTVPQNDEAQQPQSPASVLETMVHSDTLGTVIFAQVVEFLPRSHLKLLRRTKNL